MRHFEKRAISLEEQLDLLRVRGLQIDDEDRAARYLRTIGYYRLSAYFSPYQSPKDVFAPGVAFDDVLDLYIADRKLRLLALDAMERIEVAVRTAISNVMSSRCGPHWYMDSGNFTDDFLEFRPHGGKTKFEEFIGNVEYCTGARAPGRRNSSCKHYFATYNSPDLPPSWMIIEVLPMGAWSKVYDGIRKVEYQKRIASQFSFDHKHFASWVHALTLIRNCLAHHCRFWNHQFPPKAKNVHEYTHDGIILGTPYANFAMINAVLKRFTHHSTWPQRLYEQLSEWPLDVHMYMKFPHEWHAHEFWSGVAG